MANIQKEMATKITIDTVQAANSMKSFRDAISASTNSWKAMETSLKSAGNYQQAAAERVKGLTNTIELQKQRISELRERQAGLDQSTQQGAQQFIKLENQISNANKTLAGYEGQLSKAKSSSTYYSSGLSELQQSYKLAARSNEIFVKQLRAEGQNVKAQRAELDGLKASLSSLKEQYNAQYQVMNKVAQHSGKTSNSYKEQKNKLDELKLKITETNKKIKVLSDYLDKNHPAFLSNVREKLEKVNEDAKKSHTLFSNIFSANVAANLFTSALGKIHSSFSLLNDSVKEYDDKQQTMVATWDTLTGSSGKGQDMVNIGNKLAAAYGQNIEVVDELNQQFYHVFDNAPETEKLSRSVLTLGDTLNMTDDDVKRLGLNFTHMLSSGRMQLGDFNMITDQLPMYGEKLLEYEQKVQNNSQLTMGSLRDEMSAGKISAKDAEEVMNELGDKYQKASENLMKTGPGMIRAIKTQAPALLEAFYKPIREMKNPLIGQVSKWVMDDKTKKEFSKIGNTLSSQVTSVTKALSKNSNFDFGKMMNGGLEKLNGLIIKLGHNAVKHRGDLKELFNTFKSFSGTSFKVLVQTLKDLEPILKIIGGLAAKHPKEFAKVAAALLLINKSTSILLPSVRLLQHSFNAVKFPISKIKDLKSNITNLMSNLAKIAAFMAANPFTIWIVAIGALVVAFVELYKHNKKFKKFVDGLVKWSKKAVKDVIKWFKQLPENIGKFFDSIKKKAESIWNGITKPFKNGWNAISRTTTSGINAVNKGWNNLKSKATKTAQTMFNSHKKTFQSGYKVLQSYTKIWSDLMHGHWKNLGKDIQNYAKNIWKFVWNIFKEAYDKLNDLTGGKLGKMVDYWKDKLGNIKDAIADAKEAIHTKFVDIVRAIIKPFNALLSGLKKGINWVLSKLGASTISADWSIPIPSYATGTKDTHPGGLAKVNDGQSDHYREMYRLPSGELGIFPATRNMIVPLPKGTSILDGEHTYQLLSKIPHYASGVGDLLSSIAKKSKSLLSAIDPVSFMEDVFKRYVNVSSNVDFVNNIVTNLPKMIANNSVKWLKDLFKKLSDTFDDDDKKSKKKKGALAYGGLVSTSGLYELAENGKAEYVIPTDINKRGRANQLLSEVNARFRSDDPTFITNGTSTKAVERKLDTMISLLSQLLGVSADQIKAIQSSAFNKNDYYKQEALDLNRVSYQG